MPMSARWLPALAVTVVLTVAGCGDSTTQQGGGQGSTPTPTASPSADESAGHGSHAQEPVVVDVRVENGEVTPSGERLDVRVGQTVRFVVDSDAADEIHVHSVPEHTFRFGPGTKNREFEFTVTRPGVIEAELHELGDIVVTIAARP